MEQTQLGSLVESLVNTVVGFGVNYIANLVVLPMFGFDITPKDAFLMGLLFTVISVARGYVVRRWFNTGLNKVWYTLGLNKRKD